MAPKISVIGTGYLGATHAAAMSSFGIDVIGFDVDPSKVELLQAGKVPFYEPDLEELLEREIAAGRLRFSADLKDVEDADVHFICVGTPQVEGGLAADMRFVDAAVESVARIAKDGSLIVGKSTVPVGSATRLREKVISINPSLDLAWNPEFLREGFAVEDTLHPTRLVIGTDSLAAQAKLADVYAQNISEGVPWVVADLATAELVKVAANSFLATKISFINAMAEICEVAGGDVTVLAKAIGYDPRIGGRFLQAGIGFGGGCLPKDIRAFMARSQELGAEQSLEFLREIDSINMRARNRVIDLVRAELGENLQGKKVAVLGAAFKPDSDDVRDSPALDIAAQIHAAGAVVTIYDPKAMGPAAKRFPTLNFAASIDDAIRGSEILLHLTEWKIFRSIDPVAAHQLASQPILIDGRNTLDRKAWSDAGWKVKGLGRASR